MLHKARKTLLSYSREQNIQIGFLWCSSVISHSFDAVILDIILLTSFSNQIQQGKNTAAGGFPKPHSNVPYNSYAKRKNCGLFLQRIWKMFVNLFHWIDINAKLRVRDQSQTVSGVNSDWRTIKFFVKRNKWWGSPKQGTVYSAPNMSLHIFVSTLVRWYLGAHEKEPRTNLDI